MNSEDDSTQKPRQQEQSPKLQIQKGLVPEGVTVYHYEGGNPTPLLEVQRASNPEKRDAAA